MATIKTEKIDCNDFACPNHGDISLRGRIFRGTVIKKFPKRIVIEFERTIYIKKYERYSKEKQSYMLDFQIVCQKMLRLEIMLK